MRKQSVRLYAADGNFLRWIEPREASERLELGTAQIAYAQFRDGTTREVGIQIGRPPRMNERTDPAISFGEMLANVGITRPGEPGDRARFIVLRAREKVAAWPHVH